MAHTSDTHSRMPVLFLAHGNPMNALADNAFTRSLTSLASDVPRPEAILVVSAHWLTDGTFVLASERPRTIHDFGGFPEELYRVQYPAPGAPLLAEKTARLLGDAETDEMWGLDHASWTVLRHMWPDADIPVYELSLDLPRPAAHHWELGVRLSPLRDEGVLIVGSGNIVHSFAGMDWREGAHPHPWAEEFDAWVADALLRGDADSLVGYRAAGRAAALSVPTTDHYVPLLYAAAAASGDTASFTYEGIDMASMSMRCVRFG